MRGRYPLRRNIAGSASFDNRLCAIGPNPKHAKRAGERRLLATVSVLQCGDMASTPRGVAGIDRAVQANNHAQIDTAV